MTVDGDQFDGSEPKPQCGDGGVVHTDDGESGIASNPKARGARPSLRTTRTSPLLRQIPPRRPNPPRSLPPPTPDCPTPLDTTSSPTQSWAWRCPAASRRGSSPHRRSGSGTPAVGGPTGSTACSPKRRGSCRQTRRIHWGTNMCTARNPRGGRETEGDFGIYFDRDGDVVGYKAPLSLTSENCSGGLSPWNTRIRWPMHLL